MGETNAPKNDATPVEDDDEPDEWWVSKINARAIVMAVLTVGAGTSGFSALAAQVCQQRLVCYYSRY